MIDENAPKKAGDSIRVKSYGNRISSVNLELEVRSVRSDTFHTNSSFCSGISPVTQYERRHDVIIWDRYTGRRRHPSNLEDEWNYFRLSVLEEA